MQRATNRERKSRNLTLEQVVVVLSVIVVIIGRGVSGVIGSLLELRRHRQCHCRRVCCVLLCVAWLFSEAERAIFCSNEKSNG
jgi:hypothetical protein